MSFLQPRQTRKISYREQQELLRIALEEHPEFNKQGMILDTIEKGGKKTSPNALCTQGNSGNWYCVTKIVLIPTVRKTFEIRG